jgi:nitrate/TMAO reductase-like tetraheme cytochrome c subunit
MVRPEAKVVWYGGMVLIIIVGIFLLWGISDSAQSQDESTCISCHNSVRELVKITREIAAKNPPQKSTESKGEG